jgi:hypothetical protein
VVKLSVKVATIVAKVARPNVLETWHVMGLIGRQEQPTMHVGCSRSIRQGLEMEARITGSIVALKVEKRKVRFSVRFSPAVRLFTRLSFSFCSGRSRKAEGCEASSSSAGCY